MGKHAKYKCDKCDSQDGIEFISWIKNKDNTKGAFRCRKHALQEVSNYIKEN